MKGQCQPRLFLPLPSQQLSGRVVEITKARGICVSLTIKTSCGRMLQAGRGVVYAFGWWQGKADLASCMQDGKCFATILLFEKSPSKTNITLLQSKCSVRLSPDMVLAKRTQPRWSGLVGQEIGQATRDLTPNPLSLRSWTPT